MESLKCRPVYRRDERVRQGRFPADRDVRLQFLQPARPKGRRGYSVQQCRREDEPARQALHWGRRGAEHPAGRLLRQGRQ